MKVQRGFTLIEMAIVLVIITILIGGLAVPLSTQIQARRVAETNKTLEEAREALIGYAMSNTVSSPCTCTYYADGNGVSDATTCPGTVSCPVISPPASDTTLQLTYVRHYLPCPDKLDDGDPATTNDGDGVEETRVAGACPQTVGYLPWVTLGAASQDAWGNRLRYQISAAFADNATGLPATGGGDLQVCSASGCATVNVAGNVPVVLVSYGPNGWGARNVNGNTLASPTSADELENTNTDVNYVSRTPSKAGSTSGEFDDLVKWISADQLRGRICPVGGCP